MKVLPMGFRAAVEVGHQATLRIMDFVMPEGVYAQALIDNVRFVGSSKEEVLAAARRFVERCAEVNAVLNDADVPLEGRVTDRLNPKGEWLGEIIDYEAKTAECTDATLLKVRESWRGGIIRFFQVPAVGPPPHSVGANRTIAGCILMAGTIDEGKRELTNPSHNCQQGHTPTSPPHTRG